MTDDLFLSHLKHTCVITREQDMETLNEDREVVTRPVQYQVTCRCRFSQPATMTGGMRQFNSANYSILQPVVLLEPQTDVTEGDIITSETRGYDKGPYHVEKVYTIYEDFNDTIVHHIRCDLQIAVVE